MFVEQELVCTITVKEQLVEFPHPSTAAQVTVVVPSGKVLPLGGVQNTLRGAQPPEALLLKKTVALVLEQLVVVTVRLLEQLSLMGGQTNGLTVTVKVQLLVCPAPATVIVTGVFPTGKQYGNGTLYDTNRLVGLQKLVAKAGG